MRIMLVDFSYHPQIHDWVWISFYLKEENAWDIILELTQVDFFLDVFFFKYRISRDVMQSNFFFPADKYWFSLKTEDNKYSQKLASPSPSD